MFGYCTALGPLGWLLMVLLWTGVLAGAVWGIARLFPSPAARDDRRLADRPTDRPGDRPTDITADALMPGRGETAFSVGVGVGVGVGTIGHEKENA